MSESATVPTNGRGATSADDVARQVVERFLRALEDGDVDGAMELVAEDIAYTNVSLPTVHGRRAVRRLAGAALGLPGASCELHVHAIAAEGGVVLTERTDALVLGPVRTQFWVCGRFEVRDGRITVWRDYFDWADMTVAFARGLLGALVPPLRARPPAGARQAA